MHLYYCPYEDLSLFQLLIQLIDAMLRLILNLLAFSDSLSRTSHNVTVRCSNFRQPVLKNTDNQHKLFYASQNFIGCGLKNGCYMGKILQEITSEVK